MDEVRIWRTARTQAEILAHMRDSSGLENHPVSPSPTGLSSRCHATRTSAALMPGDRGPYSAAAASSAATSLVAAASRIEHRAANRSEPIRPALSAAPSSSHTWPASSSHPYGLTLTFSPCSSATETPPPIPCTSTHPPLQDLAAAWSFNDPEVNGMYRETLVARDSSGRGNDLPLITLPAASMQVIEQVGADWRQ